VSVDPALLALLACPRDHTPLREDGDALACPAGHRYAIVDGFPILLRDDVPQTHWAATMALEEARGLGDPEAATAWVGREGLADGEIDPWVQAAIGATGGNLYRTLIEQLTDYPVPRLPAPAGEGKLLLDVGCNWGRWCLAAARGGYAPVGVDPSLDAVRAARRVARQLGVAASFVVGDARHLPFRSGAFDRVFSYSVLQHFAKPDACASLAEMRRVLARGGACQVQLANAFGLRCLYQQLRRGLRAPTAFEVRYWTPGEIRRTVRDAVGATELQVDGFFSLNAQAAEAHLLPRRYRAVVALSETLRRLSLRLPLLAWTADSLYAVARPRLEGSA